MLNTGAYLTPNLVPSQMAGAGQRNGAGTQLGGEGDDIPGFQRVDFAEIVAHPPVVASDAAVSTAGP